MTVTVFSAPMAHLSATGPDLAFVCAPEVQMGTTSSVAVLREEFGKKVERRMFEPVRRLLHVEQDDRMQEGVGMTYEQFVGKAEKTGELMDDALLVHICKVRATDFSRHLARGNHTLRDASDQRNYHLGRTELVHLDGLPDDDGEFHAEGDGSIQLGLAQHLSDNPVENVVSAIDLLGWLRSLDAEDVELLVLRQRGHTIEEIAEATGLSMSVAFKRLRELGHELADRAGLPVAKKPCKPRMPKVTPQLDS